MGLTEGVSTSDQGHGLFVVHAHAGEGVTDVLGGQNWVWIAVRAFRVDVDQTHLHCCQRVLQLAVALVAIVGQPFGLWSPVHFLGLEGVHAAAGESEGRKAHVLKGNVAGEGDQVSPGQVLAVLLLHWPQGAACAIQQHVVWPGVQGSEALLAGGGATAAVECAVGAGCVPCHADVGATVGTEVRWVPVFGGLHRGDDVLLDLVQVQGLERSCVVEVLV